MSIYEQNDKILRIVKLWLEGETHIEYTYNIENDIYNLNNIKTYFYNIIIKILQELLNTTDINFIENQLDGIIIISINGNILRAYIDIIPSLYHNKYDINKYDGYDYDDIE